MAITWNPTIVLTGAATAGLSNGNLTAGGISQLAVLATVGKLSGKWYWEIVTGTNVASTQNETGIATLQHSQSNIIGLGSNYSCGWGTDGAIRINNSIIWTAIQTAVTPVSCVVGVALDIPNRRLWFAKNNTWIMSGDPASGANPVLDNNINLLGSLFFPACSPYNTNSHTARFDSGSFTYSPPSGFIALTEPSDWTGFEVVASSVLPRSTSLEDGGLYSITETVTRFNVAAYRKVRLCDQVSGRVVAEQWSNPITGLVDFPYLRSGPWILYALDHTGEFESVIIQNRMATLTGARP